MSNARKAKWSEAEVDASNAERLLGELWTEAEAHAARVVVMRDLARDLAAAGWEPGAIAELERGAMGAGTEFWAGIYRDTMAS